MSKKITIIFTRNLSRAIQYRFDKRPILDDCKGIDQKCDTVIFSLTRTTGTYRFLSDNRRLNVALSRARDNLYIVGNINYAQQNSLLNNILESAKKLVCKFELSWM